MASGFFKRYTELIDLLFKSEALDELPKPNIESKRTPFISGLFSSEPLPFDPPPAPGGRGSFIARLFSRETLPEDPVPGHGAVGRRPGH